MTLVRRNVTFSETALGREGETQPVRPTETVELDHGDDTVVDTTYEQQLSDTLIQTSDSSEATEEDVVVPLRTTRVNAEVPPVRYSYMGLVAHALAADVQVPRNWQEAMQSQQADQWRNAADTEYKSLMEHGNWELVPFPPCEEADWKPIWYSKQNTTSRAPSSDTRRDLLGKASRQSLARITTKLSPQSFDGSQFAL